MDILPTLGDVEPRGYGFCTRNRTYDLGHLLKIFGYLDPQGMGEEPTQAEPTQTNKAS